MLASDATDARNEARFRRQLGILWAGQEAGYQLSYAETARAGAAEETGRQQAITGQRRLAPDAS